MKALLVALSVLAACDSKAPPEATKPASLAAFLPSAPVGWKPHRPPVEERVAGAGVRATAIFDFNGDATNRSGIDLIEVHLAVRLKGAAGEKFKDLRKHPANDFGFFSEAKYAGRQASESPLFMDGRHLVTFRVSEDAIVDILAYANERTPMGDAQKAAFEAFASGIDFAGVQSFKP